MDGHCKRSGQIPEFGNWEYANEMPITQYFESARQAGLVRYSSSSGESNPYIRGSGGAAADLYAIDHHLHKRTRVREKRGSNVKELQKRQVKKVCDVTEPPPRKNQVQNFNKKKLHPQYDVVTATIKTTPRPKAVDEDLYKISPQLLHTSKRKKIPGFFSCLVPACAPRVKSKKTEW